MVANGFAYSLLNIPAETSRTFDGKEIRKIQLSDKLTPLVMGSIKLKNMIHLTSTVNAFLECCVKHFDTKFNF